MDNLMLRRRAILQSPVGRPDTTAKIAQYGYGLSRSNTGTTVIAGNCYTEWYEVNPVSTSQRNMTGEGVASGGANGYCFQTKTETSGNWDYWPNRKFLHANSILVRFTLITSEIDNAYVYCADGGQIFFAGKNTPYYGYTNINDMPTGD